VELDPVEHDEFYRVISNPILWFVQHGLYPYATDPSLTAREHDAFDQGYLGVNRRMADVVSQEVTGRGGTALVLFQDYHFYPAGRLVRRVCPDSKLLHFVHIPWPGPDVWRLLPPPWREQVIGGLLGNDVIGFQTVRSARNFLDCAEDLLGCAVDHGAMLVDVEGRVVQVARFPISVDTESLERLAASPEVTRRVEELTRAKLGGGRMLVLRIDRADPSKNIVRGFRAFARMLDLHPELIGRVTFLALIQPTREGVREYTDYQAALVAEADGVNRQFSTPGYRPIDLRLTSDLVLATAAQQIADVLLVNSVADGMNLVAKEGALLNRRRGALLLSECAGAYDELRDFAIPVCPLDVEQQAHALHAGLTMDSALRAQRSSSMRALVRSNDVDTWLAEQLRVLDAVCGR
jgi:trehalose 6-phosphate synthase